MGTNHKSIHLYILKYKSMYLEEKYFIHLPFEKYTKVFCSVTFEIGCTASKNSSSKLFLYRRSPLITILESIFQAVTVNTFTWCQCWMKTYTKESEAKFSRLKHCMQESSRLLARKKCLSKILISCCNFSIIAIVINILCGYLCLLYQSFF